MWMFTFVLKFYDFSNFLHFSEFSEFLERISKITVFFALNFEQRSDPEAKSKETVNETKEDEEYGHTENEVFSDSAH